MNANPSEFFLNFVAKIPQVVGVNVIRERVEFTHHAPNGRLDQLTAVDLLHIILVNLFECVGQNPHQLKILFAGGRLDGRGIGSRRGRGILLSPGNGQGKILQNTPQKSPNQNPDKTTTRHEQAPDRSDWQAGFGASGPDRHMAVFRNPLTVLILVTLPGIG